MTISESTLQMFPLYYMPKSLIKEKVGESQKRLKVIEGLLQSSPLNNVVPRPSKQFALVVLGPFELEEYDTQHKNQRLYETAHCMTKIYDSLQKCNFMKENIVFLGKKPSPDIYKSYSEHPDSEAQEFLTVPTVGLPSHCSISSQLIEFREKTLKGDSLWLFLIGHGNAKKGLILKDSKVATVYMGPDQLKNDLEKFSGRGVHLNLIVDCCFSGQFLPLTSSEITVLTSSHFDETSRSRPILGQRYTTNLITALENNPSLPLLDRHLKAVGDLSPGYDSLLYFLDKVQFTKLGAEKHKPDAQMSKMISSTVTQASKDPKNTSQKVNQISSIGFTNLSPSKTSTNYQQFDRTVKNALDLGKEVSSTALNTRYKNLRERILGFLVNASPNQVKEFEGIARPLVEKLNLKKKIA